MRAKLCMLLLALSVALCAAGSVRPTKQAHPLPASSPSLRMSLRGGAAPDVSKMKAGELTAALKARGLPTSGVKSDLAKRLQEAIENEAEHAAEDDLKRPLPLDRSPVEEGGAKRSKASPENEAEGQAQEGGEAAAAQHPATPLPASPPQLTAKVVVDTHSEGLVKVLYCYHIKDKLRKAGFSFDAPSKAWTFPAQLMADRLRVASPQQITQEAVLHLVEQEHLMDIDRIPGVSSTAEAADAPLLVAVADGVVRVTGNTYPHKEKLRAAGFRWDAVSQAWSREEALVQEALGASGLPMECTPESVVTMIETLEKPVEDPKQGEATLKPPAEVRVQGDAIHVINSYDIKDDLRRLDFTFDKETKAWARSADEVVSLLSLSSPSDVTIQALLDAAKAVDPPKPSLEVADGSVRVLDGYSVKDSLKAAGFQWSTDARAWTLDVQSVKLLCGLESEADITIDAVMKAAAAALAANGGTPRKASPSALNDAQPSIHIVGDDVQVLNSYSIKDTLKSLSFRWSVDPPCWTRPLTEVMSALGVSSADDITVASLTEASRNQPARANVARPEAYVTCTDDEACVFNSYDVKDELKNLNFRWNKDKAAWTKPLADTLKDLGVDSEGQVTMDLILERCRGAAPALAAPPSLSSFVSQPPSIEIDDSNKMVNVLNSYSIKEQLKELGFSFDQERKAWQKGVADVKALCQISDQDTLTVEMLMSAYDNRANSNPTDAQQASFLQRSPSPNRADTNPGDELTQLSSMGHSAQGHQGMHSPFRTPSAVQG